MANIKVSEMATATTFEDDDYTMIVQSNKNKKITRANILGGIESDISNLDNAIIQNTTKINNITGTILWANPNPTNDFSSQNITLSSSDYDILEFYYYVSTGNEQILSAKTLKGHGTRLTIVSTNMEYRLAQYISDTSYSIGLPTSSTDHPDYGVPIYVIGYKTGLFE